VNIPSRPRTPEVEHRYGDEPAATDLRAKEEPLGPERNRGGRWAGLDRFSAHEIKLHFRDVHESTKRRSLSAPHAFCFLAGQLGLPPGTHLKVTAPTEDLTEVERYVHVPLAGKDIPPMASVATHP
jgi:hypothetical protein